MKRIGTYLIWLLCGCLIGQLLFSCEAWDLPSRKTKRTCGELTGNLDAKVQQRKVDFTIVNGGGSADQVTWNFGNGSTTVTTGMTVSYTYPAAGNYTVQAKMTNLCTAEKTLSMTISVTDAASPTVSLQNPVATDLFTTSATLRMGVTSKGNAAITRYGICYSTTNPTPDITDPNSSTVGEAKDVSINTPLSFTLTNLKPNTVYFARSFAINESVSAPGYSSVVTFSTALAPSVAINGTPTAGTSTATVSFVLTNPGTPAAIEYGILYTAGNNTPDINNAMTATVTNPAVNANVAVNLTNLQPNTTYYYRPYAKSPAGEIAYGPIQSFKTMSNTVTEDLIASVSFTNQSVLDVSGYNNHVVLVNGPGFTTDRKGQANSAILLDGNDDYFYMNDNSSLNPPSFSISIWLKFDAIKNVNDRVQIYNKSRFEDSEKEVYSSLVKLNPDGPGYTFMTDVKQGGNCVPSAGWDGTQFSTTPDLSQWHHLVTTYTGQTIRLYFDGNLISNKSDLKASSIDVCPGGELKFGAQIKTFPNFYRGAMDDIRIYKRALTASEVGILYRE